MEKLPVRSNKSLPREVAQESPPEASSPRLIGFHQQIQRDRVRLLSRRGISRIRVVYKRGAERPTRIDLASRMCEKFSNAVEVYLAREPSRTGSNHDPGGSFHREFVGDGSARD